MAKAKAGNKLTDAVREARNLGKYSKINGVQSIRLAYPKCDLYDAKEFFDLITGQWKDVPAPNVIALWCPAHWCDRAGCGCSLDMPEIAETSAAITTEVIPPAVCICKGKPCPDCPDFTHQLAYWVAQPGNYARLQQWMNEQ